MKILKLFRAINFKCFISFQGDSSVTLNYDPLTSGKYLALGIFSGGRCDSGKPQLFTFVPKYVKWIETVTGIMINGN